MAITEAYYAQVKNVADIFKALLNAQAPEKFTQKFLYDLGFTGVNDRPFVSVLKALDFIDESGVPTQRYYDYLDEENSESVLAIAVREAYGDLFAVNQKAYEMTNEQVKGKLKSLLQGRKSDAVLKKMAATFTTLCNLADFSGIPKTMEKKKADATPVKEKPKTKELSVSKVGAGKELSLKYSINIELPNTRDQLVYDAIFRSIRENLL
jgi:hypothetical protein